MRVPSLAYHPGRHFLGPLGRLRNVVVADGQHFRRLASLVHFVVHLERRAKALLVVQNVCVRNPENGGKRRAGG